MKRLIRVFSFHGRSSRLGFWRTTLSLVVLSAVVEGAVVWGTLVSPLMGALTAILFAPLLFANVAVSARRLHDRGKSAWWLIPFTFGPAAFNTIAILIEQGGLQARGVVDIVAIGLILVGVFFWAWGWLELGFLRGQPRANRFGAPI